MSLLLTRTEARFLELLMKKQVQGRIGWPCAGRFSTPEAMGMCRRVMSAAGNAEEAVTGWLVSVDIEDRDRVPLMRFLTSVYFDLGLGAVDLAFLNEVKNRLKETMS